MITRRHLRYELLYQGSFIMRELHTAVPQQSNLLTQILGSATMSCF
jgi:hypothetical protein